MVLLKTIDAFHFKWNSIYLYNFYFQKYYHNQLSCDFDASDLVSIAIFLEHSIVHKRIWFPILLVIDVQHNWEVSIDRLEKVVVLQVLEIKLALVMWNLLVHAWLYLNLLHVVIFIWSKQHNWHIVDISLLINTYINPGCTCS
jgi:hypothetical protein